MSPVLQGFLTTDHKEVPIQSSVYGHLVSLHILAIVNSAAMNTEVYISFQISVFVHLLDYTVVLPYHRISLVAQIVKNLPAMRETWVQSLGQENPLEKGMATHSSTLA